MDWVEFEVTYVKIFLPVLLKKNGSDGYDIIHRDYHHNILCYENIFLLFFLSSQTVLVLTPSPHSELGLQVWHSIMQTVGTENIP